MKIAIIKRAIPIPGADVINTISLAQGFHNLGHNVELLCIEEFTDTLWKIRIGDIYKYFDINRKIKFKYFKGNLLYYFRIFKFNRGIINFLTQYKTIYVLIDPEILIAKYCVKKKYDLVICRDTFRAAYYNIIHNIPVIIDIHGFQNIYTADFLLKVKNSRYFKGIVTLNNFLKEKFINFGFPAKKIKVMDNAIDLRKFDSISNGKIELRKKLNVPINKKTILYSGSVQDDRGIDTIILASQYFNTDEFSFIIMGGIKESNEKWEEYIKKNGIKSDIKFIGIQNTRLVPLFLKAADILLATFSKNCPTLEFMSPVKIIEYMASKTPFIATKIGRNVEICANNECLFTEVDNPKDLSEKIKLLINDKNLQLQLVENAYKKAQTHTFIRRCMQFLDL